MHVLVWNGTVVSKILYHNTSGLLPFSVSIEKSGVMLIDLHWYVIWSFLLQLLIVFVCSVCLVFSLSIFIILGISKSNVPPFMGRELLVSSVQDARNGNRSWLRKFKSFQNSVNQHHWYNRLWFGGKIFDAFQYIWWNTNKCVSKVYLKWRSSFPMRKRKSSSSTLIDMSDLDHPFSSVDLKRELKGGNWGIAGAESWVNVEVQLFTWRLLGTE